MSYFNYFRVSFVALAATLFYTHAALSQEPSCALRRVPVTFRDAQDLPIQNISVADLDAKVQGKPVKLLSLAPDRRPHRLVLILDTSGSMRSTSSEDGPWEWELSLARHFFDVNRPKYEIAMLLFNDQVNDVVPFSQGNSLAEDKLHELGNGHDYVKNNVKGKTALYDAILRGVQLLDQPTSADAIYVLTDGRDNASRHSASEVTNRLAVSSVRLFAVLLRHRQGQRVIQEADSIDLSEIARKSGGETLSAVELRNGHVALVASPSDAKVKTEETLARFYQTIVQDSLLEIELPFPQAKNEHWDLKLSNAAHRKWKGVQITYPTTFFNCATEVASSGHH